jgi:hypothetical protein
MAEVNVGQAIAMADWESSYEKDLAMQTHSGPHQITPEMQEKNRQVFELVKPVLPFDDIHKISDCDLIYRFLIAQRFDVDKTAVELIEYTKFRKDNRLNDLLWENLPEEALAELPFFQGVDNEGNPIFYDRPSPATLGQLLKAFPRETLVRVHFVMMEQGRRLSKALKKDRVTCLLDMSLLNMSIVTNPSAIGLLKEFSRLDQRYYPENIRTMMISNSGWTFGSIITVLKPMLDVRVQNKIQKLGSGPRLPADMANYASPDQVPADFGGNAERVQNEGFSRALNVSELPIATPPSSIV